MSVESETSSVSYTGNNSTVVAYVVPFLFYKQEHLEVIVTDADEVETILALTTDYTVNGEADEDGGTLLTVEAYDNTNTITIRRSSAITQPFVFEEGQRLPMKTLEKALDYGVMHSQRVLREAQEAVAIAEDALTASAAAQAAVEAVEDSVAAAAASATQAESSADSAADSAVAAEAAQAAAEAAADIDSGDIAAALGYTPESTAIEYHDRFAERADAATVTAGSTPIAGANYRLNLTGGSLTAPYIASGALRGGNTLFYLGNVVTNPIKTATFVIEHKASATPAAVNSGNFTLGFSDSTLLPSTSATTDNLALFENMLHITFEWNQITGIGIRNSSATFVAMPTTDGLSSSIPYGNTNASGYMALNVKYTVHVAIKAGEVRLTVMGRTYVCKDARIQGDYTSWYYESQGDAVDGTQYNTVCHLHSAWINAPALDREPGLGAQPNNGLLAEWSSSQPFVKQSPTLLGANSALIAEAYPGTPTLIVGGATLASGVITNGGIHSEGAITISNPRNSTGFGAHYVSVTETRLTSVLQSVAPSADVSLLAIPRIFPFTNGWIEEHVIWGTFGTNGNTKRIKLKTGGNMGLMANMDTGDLTSNGTVWKLTMTRQGTSTNTDTWCWDFVNGSTQQALATGQFNSNSYIAMELYVTGTALGDVTILGARTSFYR